MLKIPGIITIVTSLFCGINAYSDTVSSSLRFPLAKSRLDTTFADNASQLHRISSFIASDSTLRLRSVSIIGGASPEGSTAINERLSRDRAHAIESYLSVNSILPADGTSLRYIGRDWQGLRAMVETDTFVPHRTEVLDILDTYLTSPDQDNTLSDLTLTRLKAIGKGEAYRYLFKNYFPALRQAEITIDYLPILSPIAIPEGGRTLTITSPEISLTEIPLYTTSTVPSTRRPFYMSLRTNMLYDALALPSAGAEVYLGRNISVGAEWTYGWWKSDHLHRYWRAYGGNVILRRWIGRKAQEKPLTGHHIGIYAGIFTYDFELGGKGYMGGKPGGTLWDRSMKTAGIEYGYSLPVARRLNIDFTIGIGYVGGTYLKYIPEDDCYLWQSTHKLNWFGPTKAEISLVWLIGHDNFNRKKGGMK